MQEWDLAVAEILSKRSEIDGIVIDFRNDPGGFFDDALKIASDFIPSGTIVTQRGRYNSQSFSSTGIARLVDIPVVVLVNRGSASASEIVAGALETDWVLPWLVKRHLVKVQFKLGESYLMAALFMSPSPDGNFQGVTGFTRPVFLLIKRLLTIVRLPQTKRSTLRSKCYN